MNHSPMITEQRKNGNTEMSQLIMPYRDNIEFLEDMEELILILLKQYAALSPMIVESSANQSTNGDLQKVVSIEEINIQKVGGYLEARAHRYTRINETPDGIIPFKRLSERYALDDFSQDVLIFLFIHSFSTQVRDSIESLSAEPEYDLSTSSALNCGMLLKFFFPKSLRDQMNNRRRFSLDCPLLKNNLVILEEPEIGIGTLLDLSISVTPRIVGIIADDHHQYATTSFIDVTYPEEKIENVIISDLIKTQLLTLLDNREHYHDVIKASGIEKTIAYGRSLSILEYGPSGTGKTMLARALANHLGKPLISLRPDIEVGYGSEGKLKTILRRIFLEASLRNGIVFLDECDQYLDDKEGVQTFLTEIEKTDSIIILATNKPNHLRFSLDRRLVLKIGFDLPTRQQRKRIWEVLLPKGIRLENVDLKYLADAFPLAGGYIKNAVISAIQLAAPQAKNKKITLTMDHLVQAAGMQTITIGAAINAKVIAPTSEQVILANLNQYEQALLKDMPRWIAHTLSLQDRFPHSQIRGAKILFTHSKLHPLVDALSEVVKESIRIIEVEDLIKLEFERHPLLQNGDIEKFFHSQIGNPEILLIHDPSNELDKGLDGTKHDIAIQKLLQALAQFPGVVFTVTDRCDNEDHLMRYFHRVVTLAPNTTDKNQPCFEQYIEGTALIDVKELLNIARLEKYSTLEVETILHTFLATYHQDQSKTRIEQNFNDALKRVGTNRRSDIIFG
ncbi:ATP-binding protein [Candidatus Neomarinimicrobiota bacterium]